MRAELRDSTRFAFRKATFRVLRDLYVTLFLLAHDPWPKHGAHPGQVRGRLFRGSCVPPKPAPDRDTRPDRLDHAERPGALQEAVDRAERAGTGERQNEPGAAIFQRVK